MATMMTMSTIVVALATVLVLVSPAFADVYMHNPRGSNDRNCERNVNRQNGNRLFDSQNNAKGGYACPRATGGPEIERLVPAADMTWPNTLSGQQYWEKMYYFAGSKVPIEWTSQHGCGGNKKENCQIVIQYACEDTLDPNLEFTAPLGANDRFIGAPRDGTPRDSADAATDTIPTNRENGIANSESNRRFGMHENSDYYAACTARARNAGLFTADQKLRRNDARATRQNPNGNRNGLECPEERDYYPYWAPSPWIDIAILHDQADPAADAPAFNAWCDYYRRNSQSSYATVKTDPKASIAGECVANDASAQETPAQVANRKNQGKWWNNEAECTAKGHNWVQKPLGLDLTNPAHVALLESLPPVDCQSGSFGRINHLGNADESRYDTAADADNIPHDNNAARYVWTVPNHINENCALRIRYNISTSDYPAWHADDLAPTGTDLHPLGTPGLNASFNGKDASPITQDPYVYLGKTGDEFVSLAVNTNQYGRTFQDRSYVFAIRKPPATMQAAMDAGKKVFNLNVRGKRGNIVQTYPAVEYDFVPNNLNLANGDMVHFQWTGSDYNPRRGCNNGEGGPPDPNTASAANQNSRADRSNLVELEMFADQYPSPFMFPQNYQDTKTNAAARPATSAANSMFADTATMLKMAFIKQREQLPPAAPCLTQTELEAINNKQVRENHPRNCAKLNAAFRPYFDGGAVAMTKAGTFGYYSSRNNNFSNRDQTGRICVSGPGVSCGGVGGPISAAAARSYLAGAEAGTPTAVLVTETFNFNEKDNDAFGDGESADCEGLSFTLGSLSESASVGLAVGMLFVGAAIAVCTMVGIRWYLGRPKGISDVCCGGEVGAAAAAAAAGAAAGSKASRASKQPPPPPRVNRDWLPSTRGDAMPAPAGNAGNAPPPPPRKNVTTAPAASSGPRRVPPPPPRR